MQQPAPSLINPNPNPNPDLMAPPSTSPYYPPSHYHPYYYYPPPDGPQPAAISPPVVDPTGYPPGIYFDPNQGARDWAALEAVRQFGPDPGAFVGACGVVVPSTGTAAVPSSGTEQFATTHLASTAFTNSLVCAYKGGANKKWPKKMKGVPSKKKMKVVQSACCEVCKVDCTSKEELEKHKLGKKHKRKLEILRPQTQTVSLSSTSSGSGAPVIGPQEDPSKALIANERKTKATETPEDLEMKRRRILEGGAAAEAVKTCSICNVVCNSETVLQYHLTGQKHIAALRKLSL